MKYSNKRFLSLLTVYDIRDSVISNLIFYAPSEPNVRLFDGAEIPMFQGSNHQAYGLNR